jgi:hypothetical protein
VANHRGGWATESILLFAAAVSVAAVSGLSCGSAAPTSVGAETTSGAAPLTAADTSNAARASSYAAEVARYRDIATRERQASAAYAARTPPAGATKDWNATLKARADARATAADQIATRIQIFADYFAAEAAKEVAR